MKAIVTFGSILILYLLLAGFVLEELIIGVVLSVVVTGILLKTVTYEIDAMFFIKLVKYIILYVPVFIYKLILANLDVARRVLSPTIPLNPGIVKVPTKLKGDLGRLTLANSITLTPGTLSLDVMDNAVYVHTVDVKEDSDTLLSEPFEGLLGGIFK
jgi:multicomponent Na+:H+ antiporter subunit E